VDPSSVKRRLTCILAADAVGYSKQMGEDEEGTIRVLSAHRAVIDGILTFHQGRIVSTAGDSVLAEFPSVVDAVRCAVEIQEALKTRNDSLPEHRQMHFRIGVNLGDVVVKNEDLLGDGVNVAARLETMAEAGGICISSSVYDQITGKLDLGFEDIGEQSLKNISRPIRVYRVSGTSAPQRPPPPAAPPVPASRARSSLPWAAIGMVAVAAIGGVFAWQGGWLRFGSDEPAKRVAAVASATPVPPAPASDKAPSTAGEAARVQADLEAQKLRADAEAIKRQAETERARATAESNRAAKARVDADAAAVRLRAQAEADAARIRADADAAAALTKSDAEAAAREAKTKAKAKGEAPKVSIAAAGTATSAAVDKRAAAPLPDPGRFDGLWDTTVECGKRSDGAPGYTRKFEARVKNGYLKGDAAQRWTLEGNIQGSGDAELFVVTDPKFNVNKTANGLQYDWKASGRFEGSRGAAHRTKGRECSLTFVKQ